MNAANMHTIVMIASTTSEIMAARWRRNRRMASLLGDSDWVSRPSDDVASSGRIGAVGS